MKIERITYYGIKVETFGEWSIRQMVLDSQTRSEELESTSELNAKLLQLKYETHLAEEKAKKKSWPLRLF